MNREILRRLTAREVDVLEGLCLGNTNKTIGQAIGMSAETVKIHVKTLLNKLGASNRHEAATMVMRAAMLLPCPKCGHVEGNDHVRAGTVVDASRINGGNAARRHL